MSKFESLKCDSFGFIQNIKLLHIHIHEQNFILSSIPDLGDLAIPHAIVSVNKLFKLFYTYHSL
jgi:hypothetical protein